MPLLVLFGPASAGIDVTPTPQNLERASTLGALGIMEKPFLLESVTAFIDRALAANV